MNAAPKKRAVTVRSKNVKAAEDAEQPVEQDMTDTPQHEETAEETQFPSLRGLKNLEIEKRGADNDGSADGRWRKTFVLLGDLDSLTDEENSVHKNNRLNTLSQAINNGLHPQEEATFDGAELNEDGVSVNLHYSVNVIPAIVDEEPESAVTPGHVLSETPNDSLAASA